MVMGDMEMSTDLLVIGSGPAGFSAAKRGAELGLDVIVVDQSPRPGGSWLRHGCIPCRCLFHLGTLLDDRKWAETAGISCSEPVLDVERINRWKNQRIDTIAADLESQAQRLGIFLICGRATFDSSTGVRLQGGEIRRIRFKHALIATGARQHPPAFLRSGGRGRIMNSAMALSLPDIPRELLVIGNDFVAVELAQLYAFFGSRVHFATSADCLLPGVDPDLAAPVQKKLAKLFEKIHYNARIAAVTEDDEGVTVAFTADGSTASIRYDRLLVGGFRHPDTRDLGLENTAVTLDEGGRIVCNEQQQTSDDRIFAAGDAAATPMQANIAIRQGRVAAEAAYGMVTSFDVRVIPAVIHTIPEISWCGLTVKEADASRIAHTVQIFPWEKSAKALITGQIEGLTKVIADPDSGRILGAGIVGRNSAELISEAVLAIEMGGLAEDLVLTLHPHPTLSETLPAAAEGAVETTRLSAVDENPPPDPNPNLS